MDIDPHTARAIVNSIKGVIDHDVNLFSTEGIIIASTDASRIGTLHGGALLAIRERRTVAVDATHRFTGARDGVNMPVFFHDSVVAVIGITGQRATVEPFANVIRAMTEMMIRQNVQQVTDFNQRMLRANLLSMLVSPHHDTALIDYLCSALSVDPNRTRQCLAARPIHTGEAIADRDALYEALDGRLGHDPQHLFSVTTRECRMLLDTPDGNSREVLISSLMRTLDRAYGTPLAYGLGTVSHAPRHHCQSHDTATTAVLWQQSTGLPGLCAYERMGIELIACELDASTANRFVTTVLGALSAERIRSYRILFDTYTACNGSIMRTASQLFLHKNTVQNRLNALADATGYNPRNLQDHTALRMAFLLHALQQRRGLTASGAD